MPHLPMEIVQTVQTFLTFPDRVVSSQVCRIWRLASSASLHWRSLVLSVTASGLHIDSRPDSFVLPLVTKRISQDHFQTIFHDQLQALRSLTFVRSEYEFEFDSFQRNYLQSNKILDFLKSLPAPALLESLTFDSLPELSPTLLSSLPHCLPRLKTFNIPRTRLPHPPPLVTDEGEFSSTPFIECIKSLTALEQLNIRESPSIDGVMFLDLCFALVHPDSRSRYTLKKLDVSRCMWLSPCSVAKGLPLLAGLEALETLNVSGLEISGACLVEFARKRMEWLKVPLLPGSGQGLLKSKSPVVVDVRDNVDVTLEDIELAQNADGRMKVLHNSRLRNYEFDGVREYIGYILGLSSDASL